MNRQCESQVKTYYAVYYSGRGIYSHVVAECVDDRAAIALFVKNKQGRQLLSVCLESGRGIPLDEQRKMAL